MIAFHAFLKQLAAASFLPGGIAVVEVAGGKSEEVVIDRAGLVLIRRWRRWDADRVLEEASDLFEKSFWPFPRGSGGFEEAPDLFE